MKTFKNILALTVASLVLVAGLGFTTVPKASACGGGCGGYGYYGGCGGGYGRGGGYRGGRGYGWGGGYRGYRGGRGWGGGRGGRR